MNLEQNDKSVKFYFSLTPDSIPKAYTKSLPYKQNSTPVDVIEMKDTRYVIHFLDMCNLRMKDPLDLTINFRNCWVEYPFGKMLLNRHFVQFVNLAKGSMTYREFIRQILQVELRLRAHDLFLESDKSMRIDHFIFLEYDLRMFSFENFRVVGRRKGKPVITFDHNFAIEPRHTVNV